MKRLRKGPGVDPGWIRGNIHPGDGSLPGPPGLVPGSALNLFQFLGLPGPPGLVPGSPYEYKYWKKFRPINIRRTITLISK
jgi:hypothetical protein